MRKPLARVGQEVRQEHVALTGELVEHLECAGVLEREADAALAAVGVLDDRMEVPLLPTAQPTHAALRVAGDGVLDLHDVGTPVGEDRAGRRGEGELRDLEDPHAFHRP